MSRIKKIEQTNNKQNSDIYIYIYIYPYIYIYIYIYMYMYKEKKSPGRFELDAGRQKETFLL